MNKNQRWHGIMKAYPFDETRLETWVTPYLIQPKYDGIRCRAVPQNGKVILLSSEEHIITSVPHINEALEKMELNAEVDGELYRHGLAFEEITSITSRKVNLHPDHENIHFYVFDVIDDRSQLDRIRAIEALKDLSPFVEVAPLWACSTLNQVLKVYEKLIKKGFEGIIIRNREAEYQRTRSRFIMKFKPRKEDEYVVLGSKEEIDIYDKPKGRLGALICDSGNNGTFDVGSGFDDDERNELWKNREALVGKIAKVKYQNLSSKKGKPRFPIFVELHDAK